MSLARERWLEVGNACRIARVAAGLSQAERAKYLGRTAFDINAMEHGRADPTPLLDFFHLPSVSLTTTSALRSRLRDLTMPERDDYDRAVAMVLDDFDRLLRLFGSNAA